MTLAVSKMDNSSSRSSLLFELPPELRNAIYRAALISSEPFETNDGYCTLRDTMQDLVSRIQLLHVCQQVRTEAHDIFWSETTFEATTLFTYIGQAVSVCNRLGQERTRHIKKFRISKTFTSQAQNNITTDLAIVPIPPTVVDLRPIAACIRQLRACGLPASSIKCTEPSAWSALASPPERLKAWIHGTFNEKIRDVLEEANETIALRLQLQRERDEKGHGPGRSIRKETVEGAPVHILDEDDCYWHLLACEYESGHAGTRLEP